VGECVEIAFSGPKTKSLLISTVAVDTMSEPFRKDCRFCGKDTELEENDLGCEECDFRCMVCGYPTCYDCRDKRTILKETLDTPFDTLYVCKDHRKDLHRYK